MDTLKARVDALPAIIKRFRQSVLAAAVSGKLTEEWRADTNYADDGFPASWGKTNFDKVGELARGKSKHRPRNDPKLFGDEYPFIQTGEVAQSGGIISTYTKAYSQFGLEQSRLFPEGTLCITIAANIADTATLFFPACFPDSVVGFIGNKNLCEPLFIKYFIDVNKEKLEQFAPATAQKNINLKVLKGLHIPYPSLDEQKEIVAKVEELFTYANKLESQITQAQNRINKLTQSILAKAFRGELVPQNPDDEPAEQLLARIRAQREAEALLNKSKKRTTRKKKATA